MDTGVLEQRFEEIYGTKVEHLYFAPGRVNLIGEHIDYNGGRVFPCALSFGTYLAVARRDDRKIAFASMNQTFQVECDQSIFENKPDEWVKYPLGVVKEFSDRGLDPWGFNILYFGDNSERGRVILVSLERGRDGVYAKRSVECRAGRGGVGENVTTGRECFRGYELRDYGPVCRGYGKERTRYCAGLQYFVL